MASSPALAADTTSAPAETHTKARGKKAKHTSQDAPAADATAADNTAVNKRDRADTEKTADQAKNDKSDVELTAEIRRAVMDDKQLSTNAHNVKIIVENGHVTLKGPVASAAEKATVEQKAAEVAGHARGRVTSEINIAP